MEVVNNAVVLGQLGHFDKFGYLGQFSNLDKLGHCDVYLADVGHMLCINGYYFIFLAYTNVCSVTELT